MSAKNLNEPIIISDQKKESIFEKCSRVFDDLSAKELMVIVPVVLVVIVISIVALWTMGPDPMI